MLWVSDHQSYEIEDGIWETEPLWLGKSNSEILSGKPYLEGYRMGKDT